MSDRCITEFEILKTISDNSNIIQTQIAKHVKVGEPHVRMIVRYFVKAEIIKQYKDRDNKRRSPLRITSKGKRLLIFLKQLCEYHKKYPLMRGLKR